MIPLVIAPVPLAGTFPLQAVLAEGAMHARKRHRDQNLQRAKCDRVLLSQNDLGDEKCFLDAGLWVVATRYMQ